MENSVSLLLNDTNWTQNFADVLQLSWSVLSNKVYFFKESFRYYKITSLKSRLKITQHEKVHFIKVNELKLTQVELFWFFHFMCVAANASEVFCMAYIANIGRFLYHSNVSF